MKLLLLWIFLGLGAFGCGRGKTEADPGGDLAVSLLFPAGIRNHPEKLREVLEHAAVLTVKAEKDGEVLDEAAFPPRSWDRIALPRLDLRRGTFRVTARVFHRTRADVPWFVGHTDVNPRERPAEGVRILLRTFSTP